MGPEDRAETEQDVSSAKAKPKIDLKGIITSVEYFDEEKYEGGKRVKKGKKSKLSNENKEVSTETTSEIKEISDPQENSASAASDAKESSKRPVIDKETSGKSPKKV